MKWPEEYAPGSFLPLTASLMAVLALSLLSWLGFGETRATLTQIHLAEAETIAREIRADLDRAIGFGIPLDELPGVDAYLAARLKNIPEIRFFMVTGPAGQALHQAGITGDALGDLVRLISPARLAGAKGDAGLARWESPPFALVVAPLRNSEGAVLVGVEPGQITLTLIQDLTAAWPFWLGCLLLPLTWAWVAIRGGVWEPLAQLAATMSAAARGHFDRLLIRRSRDPVGRCLLAFNSILAGLYARRQAMLTQANDVHQAVFDPEVARAVVATRDLALQDLGEGLAKPPVRFADPRASDGDLFALTFVPAGILGASTLVLSQPASWQLWSGMILGFLLAMGLGWLSGWRRGWAIGAATLFLAVLLSRLWLPQGGWDLLVPGTATTTGLALGMAWRQRRLARRAGGLGGGHWILVAGCLGGLALAWGLHGNEALTRLGATGLTLIALAGALLAPGRQG